MLAALDPRLDLARNRFIDGELDPLCHCHPVDGNAVFTREHDLDQIIGPRQAADMSSQEAIVSGHESLPDVPTAACAAGPCGIVSHSRCWS
jgi:hypothetical protein